MRAARASDAQTSGESPTRRLETDRIFLHYRGEPHHPQKHGNRLGRSIRMQEYFDSYLKREPAADWITTSVPRVSHKTPSDLGSRS